MIIGQAEPLLERLGLVGQCSSRSHAFIDNCCGGMVISDRFSALPVSRVIAFILRFHCGIGSRL
jgi:hypothetical protein